jgi:hypothetical protein
MNTTEELRDWLNTRKGDWPHIADLSGVGWETIRSFARARTKTLRSNNFEALIGLMRKEARAKRRKSPKVSAERSPKHSMRKSSS